MHTKLVRLLAAGAVAAAGLGGLGIHAPAEAASAGTLTLPAEHVEMVIVPAIRLGIDTKLHDAFTPTDITARAGQRVVVTVYNYDTGSHSFTSAALHLNVVFPAASRTGVPSVKTFTFTAAKAGSYHWQCVMPCDDTAKGWAMSHDEYMAGTVAITKA